MATNSSSSVVPAAARSSTDTNNNAANQVTSPVEPSSRRTSFSFLRRTKSNSGTHRSVSGGRMGRKEKARREEELLRQQREAAMLPKQPPRLPNPPALPTINTFGGENAPAPAPPAPALRPDSYAYVSQHADVTSPTMEYRSPQSFTSPHAAALPPITSPTDELGPYAQAESMTHRGRYSYASPGVGAVSSARRVRRRKDPTPFNILVIGARNSGKTSFIEFLRTSLALPEKKRAHTPPAPQQANSPDSPFTSQYVETEFDNERIGVTVWDSEGLEKNVVDLQLREMASFLESKFEETFTEEQKVVRTAGVLDTHVHCVFLLLDPSRLDGNITASRRAANDKLAPPIRVLGCLDDEFDLQILRMLQNKTTVIPVISKADTITTSHMGFLKRSVWDGLKQSKLDLLEVLGLDSDVESLDERDEDAYNHSSSDNEHDNLDAMMAARSDSNTSRPDSTTSASSPSPNNNNGAKHRNRVSAMSAQLTSSTDELPYIPLSIISPDMYDPGVVGRRFPWGFADPLNTEHCDFPRLKESVFSEWRAELREASRERWYEGWRTERLKRRGVSTIGPKRAATSTF
ncbi:uncharacterized protein K452DRAFT_302393 [Aplosporella prunicola CBS 121167]|uniref:Septin-type G domain-containing protein n=1 Tax=Aplosporella prunicola CBS 121167 TaxID=1176127 RepID=A0A6A6AZ30_9PEZI|nr:uncharacterized protein K452DRAFT_302393 [Aplosporella prunicola CBS 121167]KAF2136896.1 hypothetical protein K452DRAFT_302393 [Aplosporella prunicola CBS 121167]